MVAAALSAAGVACVLALGACGGGGKTPARVMDVLPTAAKSGEPGRAGAAARRSAEGARSAAAGVMAGRGRTRQPGGEGRLSPTPVEDAPEAPAAASLPVVYARPGEKLVVPVNIDEETIRRGNIPARLDSGGKLFAPLYWIGVVDRLPRRAGEVAPPPEAPEMALVTRRAAEWTGKSAPWAALAAGPSVVPGAVGTWAVVLEVPREAAGEGVWLGGRKLTVRWLEEPAFGGELFAGERGERVGVGGLGGRGSSVWLSRALDPVRKSPLTRWRARLAAGDRVDPKRDAPDMFVDPIVEALAQQVEAQWSVGLENLARVDRAMAVSLKRRLALTADFGEGVVVPAWTLDPAGLQALLNDVLSTELTDGERARAAGGWLEMQPTAAAWVLDDAGTTDAVTGASVSSLGYVNLGAAEVAVSAFPEGGGSAPDMNAVKPGAAGVASVVAAGLERGEVPGGAAETRPTLPRGPRSPELRTERVSVRVGDRELTRTVMVDALQASPPGVEVGPLIADWSLGRWLAAAALTPDDHGGLASVPNPGPDPIGADRVTLGRLSRELVSAEEGGGETGATRWVLYVECLVPREAERRDARRPTGQPERPVEREADAVTVFFGPFGSSRAVVRVTSDGTMISSLNPTGVGRVRISRQADRWAAWIPVPEEALDRDGSGLLRVGVVRVDERGVRSAWPRAMLPWQKEPGRVCVDLGAWEGFGR
jgi:hypothetical protein